MDLALNIKGNSSGAGEAFSDVASDAQSSAAAIEQAFAGMAKKTEAAFDKMESETTASMKKMGDEGAAAWKKAEDAERANAAQLAKVQAGLLAVGAAAVAFGVDSVRAFAEAEKVQKQLERVAGDLTDAFSQQADALESQLSIDGELIKQQQTLLLQWGAAPSQIEPTIRAIEDYAAATGKDALTATMELIKGVETGGAKFQALGVHYQETSDKTENLTLLTQGLADKFGGAAAVNAASLTGRMNALNIAMGNVKEGFGGVIASMESKLGVMDKVAGFMSSWASRIGGAGDIGGALLAISPIGQGGALGDMFGPGPQAPDITGGPTSSPAAIHLKGFTDDGPDKVAAVAKKAAATKAAAEALKAAQELEKSLTIAHLEFNREYARKYQEEQIKGEDAAAQESVAIEKARVAALKEESEALAANQEENAKRQKDIQEGLDESAKVSIDKALQMRRHQLEEGNRLILQQEQAWADAGTAIGMALVNSVGSALERLASGADLDAGEVMANIIGDVLAVAGQVIGTVIGGAYGGPGGAQLGGAIGGAVGGLGGAGVKALGKAGRKKKYHSGGWVGDEIDVPRYHSGAWIGADERSAILQTGERVLSRAEVARAGGPAGVDSMAKGGGGFNITIQTIDAVGTRQFFENDGGRGFFNALRTGRGSLLPAFGGG